MKIVTYLLILLAFTANCMAGPKMVKVASLEWPPYAGETLPNKGEAVATLVDALRTQNIGVTFDFLPWERALLETKKGDFDAYFPAWPEEVAKGFLPTKTITMSTVGVIGRKADAVPFESLEKLFTENKIAMVKGYTYSDEITNLAATYKENVIFPKSEQLAMRMLHAIPYRFDYIITDFRVVDYYNRQEKKPDIVEVKRLYEKPLVMAVRSVDGDSSLRDVINSCIKP